MTRPARAPALLTTLGLVGCFGGDPSGLDVPVGYRVDGKPAHEPYGDGFMARMGEIIPMATPEQRAAFERGEKLARKRFTPEEGLGPSFNGVSCLSCHERPVLGGGGDAYRDMFMGGTPSEKGYTLNPLLPETEPVQVSDGVARMYHMDDDGLPAQHALQAEVGVMAARNPTALFGSGVIMTIPAESILAALDPEDKDGDGISGRTNTDAIAVGRLGSKAMGGGHTSLMRIEFFVNMGVSIELPTPEQIAALPFPEQLTGHGVFAADPADPYPDPELSQQDYLDVLTWAQLLAAPAFDPLDDVSGRGRDLFAAVGCADCHTPRLPSPYGPVPAYTDFLMHDMGDDLGDNFVMDYSTPDEFKTLALWGVAATAPYLHDGRAITLDEAIRLHGGEGAATRDRYVALPDTDREAVIAFLRTLGGAALAAPGLLPAGAPLVASGQFGAPRDGLDPSSLDAFRAGRAAFDRMFGVAEGMGLPRFNGDSCRACHQDPVIGGAGPLDVNVLRMGHGGPAPADAQFEESALAHRQVLLDGEPWRVPATAKVIEARQTTPLFGLGLVDTIPADAIVAGEDPDDTRAPKGISGRAARLPDGTIGRFGWKAQVPTLLDFTQSALGDEMGLTTPQSVYGRSSDGDTHADPEVDAALVGSITAFVTMLDAPPRGELTDAVRAGEALFASVGCADCHVPVLESPSGPVPLYSDLLLHDILPAGTPGITQAAAGPTEFRTPPLWGLRATGPYMHHGRATTVEAAIALHDAEGLAARKAFAALSPDARAQLVAFLMSL